MTVKSNAVSKIEARNGSFSLKVRGDDGSIKTLHSLYDPVAEAQSLVEAFHFDGRGILVVLGLGLGYHVDELAKKFPQAQILVVEALTEIYDRANEQFPYLKDRAEFITGMATGQALREITGRQMKGGIKPLSVFTLPSALSVFPSYYQPILDSLNRTVAVKLWERLRYPKFSEDVLNVAIIDTGYFLVREAEKALKSLGHRVVKIVFGNDNSDALMPRFIQTIVEHRPDFILTINHLGFDEQGVLASFLGSIGMPVASWYVDSPRLIVRDFEKNVSPYVSVFLWDREYIGEMYKTGFESVTYLPLGADENVFRPMKLKEDILKSYKTDICFVGNSLVASTQKNIDKLPSGYHALAEKVASKIHDERISFRDAIRDDQDRYEKLPLRQKFDIEAAVLWKATLLYRLSCMEQLKDFRPQIYGDHGWKTLLNSGYQINGPLNYYNELPLLYNACSINFNATHLQMGDAVNQRVFDVPACGAFLLTDYQKSLGELFRIGDEIVVYRDKNEIQELVKYYLDNPEKRADIAHKGRARILKEHTYSHRLNRLIQEMVKRYKKY